MACVQVRTNTDEHEHGCAAGGSYEQLKCQGRRGVQQQAAMQDSSLNAMVPSTSLSLVL